MLFFIFEQVSIKTCVAHYESTYFTSTYCKEIKVRSLKSISSKESLRIRVVNYCIVIIIILN
jgi:hypothetical protein